MFKKFLDFIFEPEPDEIKLKTLLYLATKVYVQLYGNDYKKARELAIVTVNNWVREGKTDKALKMLWKSGKAA